LSAVTAIATIRILCEADTSLGSAVVNGLLAWATIKAHPPGCTVLFTGLPAAVAMILPDRAETLSKRLDRWLAVGFILGMSGGLLMFFVFVARIAS
jgi:hypothetical protein